MRAARRCDLLIIGGGPAGSTLGTLFKKYNPKASVVIAERAAFPRHHVGESLLPVIKPILSEMGALEKIEAAGFPKKMGGTYLWGENRKPWDADFSKLTMEELVALHGGIPEGTPYAWQVRRAQYDHILLEHARAVGVEILRANAENIIEEEERIAGARFSRGGKPLEIRSRWLADCSGQSGFLSRYRRIREFDERLKNVAAYAYFRGARWRARFTGHPDKTRIFICSARHGWFWYIPVAADLVSVGLVTSHQTIKDLGVKDLRSFYKTAIDSCPEIAELVQGARWAEDVDGSGKDFFTMSDWSYLCREAAGEGWLAAGDAAVFVDPVFSSGVSIAHLTAQRVAYILTELMKGQQTERQRRLWSDYGGYCREVAAGFLVMALCWYGNDRSQKALWRKAREIYSAHLPEPGSDAKAYVAVVSGVLAGADRLGGFNFDDPRQENFFRGIRSFDEVLSELPKDADQRAPGLLYPFEISHGFAVDKPGGLKDVRRVRFIKNKERAAATEVLNPRAAIGSVQLAFLRLMDGRRTLAEIRRDLADYYGFEDDAGLVKDCQGFLRQLLVWEVVELRAPGEAPLPGRFTPKRAQDWVSSSDPLEWETALAARRRRVMADFEGLYRRLCAEHGETMESFSLRKSFCFFLHGAHPEKEAIVLHPAFHGWLCRMRGLLEEGGRDRLALRRHYLHFQGFAAALALKQGARRRLRAACDGEGHIHLHGLGAFIDLGKDAAGAMVELHIDAGRLVVQRSRHKLLPLRLEDLSPVPRISDRLEFNTCDPLVAAPFRMPQGAYDHAIAEFDAKTRGRYIDVLQRALAQVKKFDQRLFEELASDIRTVVPLENPRGLTSVSSTYDILHGAIGLSHSEDIWVQAETLIHEFAHNKLNMLLETSPIFAPESPAGDRFYSPWRQDPRPLRGMLLGAHAFFNTLRFALFALKAQESAAGEPARRKLRLEARKTALRVEIALRCLSKHGVYTEFGRAFVLEMAKALADLKRSTDAYAPDVLAEALRAVEEHREKFDAKTLCG